MRKKKFTLVEMLTVIAIIGVLAGILIPTITISKRRAQEATAKTEVSSIVAAIKAYRQQYNKLPLKLTKQNNNKPTGKVTPDEYVDFMEMLCGKNVSGTNPRQTKFLTPRAKDSAKAGGGTVVPAVWLDPWGREYRIFLDEDYDNKVDVNADELHGDIFVYSLGIDGDETPGKKNNEEKNKDNVTSWDSK